MICVLINMIRFLPFLNMTILLVFAQAYADIASMGERCNLIKIKEAQTQFCLDKRFMKNCKVEISDRRTWKINQGNEVVVFIITPDLKFNDVVVSPGTSSWREVKILSGISINVHINFSPWFKDFEELAKKYSSAWYEPHNESPMRKGGTIAKVNDLQYISALKVNDPDSWSKGLEIETNFLCEGKHYTLEMMASPKSISKHDFILLHDNILKTIQCNAYIESNDAETVVISN